MDRFLRRLVAPAIAVMAPLAQAQFVDDIDFRREGAHAVMQVRFVTPVQYRRSMTVRSGDTVQAFYDVVAGHEQPGLVISERRFAPRGALPEIIVTDDSAGRSVNASSRRLVIRLGTAVPLTVRAGKGDRTIEVVFHGMASALAPAAPQGAAVPAASTAASTAAPPTAPPAASAAVPAPAAPSASAPAAALPPGPPASAAAPAPTPAPATTAEATPPPAPLPTAELDAQGVALLAAAKAADAQQDLAAALDKLNQLLNLPPNAATREAQALAGDVRLKQGDTARARAEYETFLKLYPTGPDADRVRAALQDLPQVAQAPRERPKAQPSATLTGSLSAFYYGGASKVRTQEFQDSPISGLPELVNDNTLSDQDLSQLMTNVDVNWRYRDADKDMRFVFRDAYTEDLLRSEKSRNRLSALYFEHRALQLGTQVKLGRQSPTGGGVLNRFDGVQAGYSFLPKWRINAAAGVPTDKLLDSRRHFYGAWVDADALTASFSGSLYVNQQVIDGEVDRRAVGTELRYFSGGVSVSSILDYDQIIRGLNIASLQGTWQREDNTVVNFLYDHRATPLLMLGNAVFFGTNIPAPTATDPNATRLATSIRDLLDNGRTVEGLRETVKATTTYTTQGLLGVTTPINKHWQIGGDIRLTKLGEIPPIAEILPAGQGRSDNQAAGLQLIGTNLYSARDTHVIGLTVLKGSSESRDMTSGAITVLDYTGQLLSYNNSSQVNELLLLEPSIKFYFQRDNTGVKTSRVNPGLRVTYRILKQFALESELSGEYSKVTSPTRNETSNRVFYYLGGRYDF